MQDLPSPPDLAPGLIDAPPIFCSLLIKVISPLIFAIINYQNLTLTLKDVTKLEFGKQFD